MPYLVTKFKRKPDRVTLYDLFTRKSIYTDETATRTYFYKDLSPKTSEERLSISNYVIELVSFRQAHKDLIDIFKNNKFNYEKQVKLESKYRRELKDFYKKEELEQQIRERVSAELNKSDNEYCDLYHTFYVPKNSRNKDGSIKWRRIDAPNDKLKYAQRALKELISHLMNGLTYHTAACGYVEKRSIVQANEKHIKHGSRFHLMLDCKNFFNSITIDFVIQQLKMIFPFSEICNQSVLGESAEDILRDCLRICFLSGVLPQGTPISPMLTNIIMIPIDHKISTSLQSTYNAYSEKGYGHKFVYTRYADDIKISNRINFKPCCNNGMIYSNVKNKEGCAINVEKYVEKVLKQFNAPFTLNKEKSKYGSIYQENHFVGIGVNANNNLTLGQNKKDLLKAKLWDFGYKYMEGNKMNPVEASELLGLLNYHNFVEPDRTTDIKNKTLKKLNTSLTFEEMLKNCIRG